VPLLPPASEAVESDFKLSSFVIVVLLELLQESNNVNRQSDNKNFMQRFFKLLKKIKGGVNNKPLTRRGLSAIMYSLHGLCLRFVSEVWIIAAK
jgi:hypothetical protein